MDDGSGKTLFMVREAMNTEEFKEWIDSMDEQRNDIDVRCCDALVLLKSLPDKSIDLIFTDPPYGFLNGSTGGKYKNENKNSH